MASLSSALFTNPSDPDERATPPPPQPQRRPPPPSYSPQQPPHVLPPHTTPPPSQQQYLPQQYAPQYAPPPPRYARVSAEPRESWVEKHKLLLIIIAVVIIAAIIGFVVLQCRRPVSQPLYGGGGPHVPSYDSVSMAAIPRY